MAETKIYAGKEGIQELWRKIKAEIGKFTAFQKKPAAPDGTPDVPVDDRKTNIIYLVEEDGATPPDMCKEWIWTLPEEGEGEWVCIGDTSTDLSDMARKSEMTVESVPGDPTKKAIQLKSGLSANVLVEHQDISGKQDVISDLGAIRTGAAAGATAYQKPDTGIPSSDMTATAQASLGKADSAVQGVKLAGAETPITPDAGNIVTIPTFSKNGPGLVPSAEASDADKALRGDGTWGDAPFATAIAPEYDSTSTYPTVGTAVMYKGVRYVSNTAITTAEAWTPAHWDESDVESQFTAVEEALSDVNDILEDLSVNPGMTDLGNKTEENLVNGALTIATGNSTTKLTLATINALTVISNVGVPNFALTIDNTGNSNNVTVSVVEIDGTTALLNSTVAGTTITAGTCVQLTAVGNCWTMAEFDIPSI